MAIGSQQAVGALPLSASSSWQELRAELEAAGEDDLWQGVLLQCQRALTFSRHHWLRFDGEEWDRQGFKALVADTTPTAMSDREARLVFCLYVLGCGNLGLEQIDGELCAESVDRLIDVQWASYAAGLGERTEVSSAGLSPAERASLLRAMRGKVDRGNYRYSLIDGERWFRSESLIPHEQVDLEAVPDCFCAGGAAGREGLQRLAQERVDARQPLEELVVAIMRHALADGALGVDHITLTAPRQLGPVPEDDFHQRANIYRRTETRDGLELAGFEEQLGHASDERLKKVIAARMQVLKLKAAKQFFGDGCMGGEAMDKSGDYMIFFNEDAHYPGHRNAGCSTGGRAPIPLRIERGGVERSYPGIFADLRAVRLTHDPAQRFTEAGLEKVIQYASWISTVLAVAYECEIQFDGEIGGPESACPADSASDERAAE